VANFLRLFKRRQYLLVFSIASILGLANIRVVIPGTVFYGAFHMVVWFALFIFITALMIVENSRFRLSSLLAVALLFFYFVNSNSYFAKEKIDQHEQHITNYGSYLQEGEVIKTLASPGDTLFLDGSDDLIYWQAKLPSPYKYSWYTSTMPSFTKYSDARLEMFKKDPPDFYREYGSCPKKIPDEKSLPDFIKSEYARLYNLDKPSCLFVRKDKLKDISQAQWAKANQWLYSLNNEKD
jgi:hypothetical protein